MTTPVPSQRANGAGLLCCRNHQAFFTRILIMSDDFRIRELADDDSVAAITALLHAAYGSLAANGFRYLASHQDDAMTLRRLLEGHPISSPSVRVILSARSHFTGRHLPRCANGIGGRLSILSVSSPCVQTCNGVVSACECMNTSRQLPVLLLPWSWRWILPRARYIFGAGMSVLVSGSSSLYRGKRLITEASFSRNHSTKRLTSRQRQLPLEFMDCLSCTMIIAVAESLVRRHTMARRA